MGGVGVMSRQSTEDLGGGKNILHDSIMMDICPYTFVQTHRMYHTKK